MAGGGGGLGSIRAATNWIVWADVSEEVDGRGFLVGESESGGHSWP